MSDAVLLALIGLANTAIVNFAVILGALGGLGALWVSIRNGRKVDSNAVQMAEVKQVAEETKVMAHEAKKATVDLQDGQNFLKDSLATNTMATKDIQAAIAGYVSRPGDLR